MKTPFSRALRKARSIISADKHEFICIALKRVDAPQFRRRVSKQLGDCYTYDDWLAINHPRTFTRMRRIGMDAFQEGRLQWIDHMIQQEEA